MDMACLDRIGWRSNAPQAGFKIMAVYSDGSHREASACVVAIGQKGISILKYRRPPVFFPAEKLMPFASVGASVKVHVSRIVTVTWFNHRGEKYRTAHATS